jgi:NTE family protein
LSITIALSGGGVRAAVFHLGFLLRLAADGRLDAVKQISTVSGGSLVTAAVFSVAEMQWPTSDAYIVDTYPRLRTLLTNSDLFSAAAIGWSGLCRRRTEVLFDRARILADLLSERWGIRANLADLPDAPTWWINAACLETGKNWRFSKREMGDWKFGRHYRPPFTLAECTAASAAVPYVIGALGLTLPSSGWYRTNPATRAPIEPTHPASATIRLWDGGVYENLGLEAVYKPGRSAVQSDFIICSDASGPLGARRSALALLKGQLASPRLFDISSDQIRSLRSRMFIQSLTSGEIRGALLRMGNSVRDIDMKAGFKRQSAAYDEFQSENEVALALAQPTDLKAVSHEVFDRIARHGFEIADATLTAYAQTDFSNSLPWRSLS